MFFIFKRGQEEFNGLSVSLQQSSAGPYIHLFSVFSECPAHSPTVSGSVDLGHDSLYIIKSVFTVLSLLGTYIITSPAIPIILTTNVSNQAFSWRVEIKGKGHSPAFKQISEPMFGSIVSCKHVISNKQILLNVWACHRRGLQMHPPSI